MIRKFAEDVNPILVVAESLLGGFGFFLVSTAVGMYVGFAIGVETPEYNMLPSLAFFGGCGIALSLTGWWFGRSVRRRREQARSVSYPGLENLPHIHRPDEVSDDDDDAVAPA